MPTLIIGGDVVATTLLIVVSEHLVVVDNLSLNHSVLTVVGNDAVSGFEQHRVSENVALDLVIDTNVNENIAIVEA